MKILILSRRQRNIWFSIYRAQLNPKHTVIWISGFHSNRGTGTNSQPNGEEQNPYKSLVINKVPSSELNQGRASSTETSTTDRFHVLPSSETNQNSPNIPDFDAKIQSLRNKLYPDNLIKILKSTSDVNSAVKIFKWASLQGKFNHTADTYYWIIFKLGIAGNVEEMEGFCQNMVKERCTGEEDVLVSLVDAFVRNFRLNEAMRVLFNMNLAGIKPSIDVFNFVLGALVEEKRGFQDVVFVYKEMVKAGVAPSIDTLNYLMEVLFETDRVDSALDQYRRINKKGCSPDCKTFEIVIKGLIDNNRVDDSVAILHEMLELGCLHELSFYRNTIPLFCREDRLEEGIMLFRKMKESNFTPDTFIYGALIQCLCKQLRLDEAVNLLEEMMESQLEGDDNVFVDVVLGFCKLGKINEAVKLLEDKHVLETSPHNALLRCCCDADKFPLAKGLLEKMSERNIDDCDSWNILIRWLCEREGVVKAYELLGRMIISSLIPDYATYSALVAGNCRLGKYEDALQLFLQLHAKCWILDPASYSELIEGLCRGEKYLEAVKVFCYMSENGCSLQSFPFIMLIKGICDMGMIGEAVRLQLLAYNSGLQSFYGSILHFDTEHDCTKPNKGLHYISQCDVSLDKLASDCEVLDSAMYNILINGLWKEGNINEAHRLLDLMLEKGWDPRFYDPWVVDWLA
ncbi:hypothetical protein OIU79_018764 [Salix purpurea]|uniref:Pentatricopeptide repeat-containing protein-mitochondrial domain-containing protein n=1 Tax=Salix purpurea TaxID=77065 RepID=A0A9Q0WYU4_SALPP|nr:hypothetical protein OIU79_018764 [Salix purpurea]